VGLCPPSVFGTRPHCCPITARVGIPVGLEDFFTAGLLLKSQGAGALAAIHVFSGIYHDASLIGHKSLLFSVCHTTRIGFYHTGCKLPLKRGWLIVGCVLHATAAAAAAAAAISTLATWPYGQLSNFKKQSGF